MTFRYFTMPLHNASTHMHDCLLTQGLYPLQNEIMCEVNSHMCMSHAHIQYSTAHSSYLPFLRPKVNMSAAILMNALQ